MSTATELAQLQARREQIRQLLDDLGEGWSKKQQRHDLVSELLFVEESLCILRTLPPEPAQGKVARRSLGALLLLLALCSSARAGSISLPCTLAQADQAGTTITEGNLTFSDFSYSGTPAAANITVSAANVPGETGLVFSGAFTAPAGMSVSDSISYTVSAAPGTTIDGASLALAGGTTGTAEIIAAFEGAGRLPIKDFLITLTDPTSSGSFPPQTSMFVTDLIDLTGSDVSSITQGYAVVTCEPPTLILLAGGRHESWWKTCTVGNSRANRL